MMDVYVHVYQNQQFLQMQWGRFGGILKQIAQSERQLKCLEVVLT